MKNLTFQELLSLGYVYLLVLGIIIESIYYQFIGINILSYSGILDVLMSPISLLTSDIRLPIIFIMVLIFVYTYPRYIIPRLSKTTKTFSLTESLRFAAVLIFLFFSGLGIGRGGKMREVVTTGQAEPRNVITIRDKGDVNARIIGQNSMYLFYVPEGGKEVVIVPIADNVRQIKGLKK